MHTLQVIHHFNYKPLGRFWTCASVHCSDVKGWYSQDVICLHIAVLGLDRRAFLQTPATAAKECVGGRESNVPNTVMLSKKKPSGQHILSK